MRKERPFQSLGATRLPGRAVQETTKPVEALTEPQPKAALAYWNAKRGERDMPAPSDIDAAEIPRLLPYLCLIEVLDEDPPDYRYRIEGDAVRTVTGFTRRGKRLSEMREIFGPAYALVTAPYAQVCATKRPRVEVGFLRAIKRDFYCLEVLYLPLSQDGRRVERILCCIGIQAAPEDLTRLSGG